MSVYSFPSYSMTLEEEEWGHRMYLVHVSPIMLRNSTAIAGALNLGSAKLVVGEDENIRHR